MGGGGVGRVSIDVDADISKAASKLKELLKSFPDKEIQSTAKAINSLKSELSGLERAFKGKTLIPGSREANEINRVKDAIERLGGATDRNVNFITRHAAAINQLSFAAARAGHGFANFLPLISRSSTLLAKAANEGGGASGALASLRGAASGASGALAGIGLPAIAAAAAILALAAGVIFLIAKLGPLGSALTKAQNSIKLIFEDAGQDMLDFARTASTAFGITEQAALRFIGKTGQLFKSFGVGAGDAGQLSKALLVTGDVLRSTSTEFIASEEALQAVFDTVAGNVEGLRKFDIFLSEIGLTQVALRNGLKVTTGAFDNFQRSLVSQIAAIEQAKNRFEQYKNTMDSTQRTAERTKAAFTDIKAAIGQGLAPILSFVANVFLGIVVILKNIVNAIGDFIKRNADLVKALKKVAEVAIGMYPGLNVLAKVLGFLHSKGKDAAEGALNFDEALEELNAGIEEAREQFNNYKKVLTVTELYQLVDAHKRVKEAVENAARAEKEAQKDLTRAREDAVRKLVDAQRDIARAYRDRNRAVFDANEKLADAELAFSRALFDGWRRLEEVQLQTSRSIRNAEEKLLDARVQATRKLIKAEEDLAKARRKNALDIVSSFRAVEDAQNSGDVQAERSSRFQLSEALRGGDITDAEREKNELLGDSKKELARLERDLAEERLDAIKKIQDAEIARDRAITDGLDAISDAKRNQQRVFEDVDEKIADAQRKLHEVEIENNRALYDAKQRVLETERQSVAAINEANEALDRLNENFGTTDMTLGDILDKLERMKNTLIGLTPLEGTYGRRVGSGTSPGGFAHGGRLSKWEAGWVGEQGRELFIPDRSGTIIPHRESERIAGGRTETTVIINQNERDAEELGFAIMERLSAEASR